VREQPLLKRKGEAGKRTGDASGSYSEAMNAALRLLSFRPRTAQELSDRLHEKGFNRELAARVCERLKGLSYIDDRQFAISWLKSFSGPRCRNAWVLKRELRKKGVAPGLAEEVVEEHFKEEDAFNAACRLARQRIGKAAGRDVNKAKARVQNMLLRRGFDYDFIRKVLAEATDAKGE
jgi:regulatory protein